MKLALYPLQFWKHLSHRRTIDNGADTMDTLSSVLVQDKTRLPYSLRWAEKKKQTSYVTDFFTKRNCTVQYLAVTVVDFFAWVVAFETERVAEHL